MEILKNYKQVVVKYPWDIKIGDLILFESSPPLICDVIKIEKGKRHSREDGYPYIFTGNKDNVLHKTKYWSDVIKLVPF